MQIQCNQIVLFLFSFKIVCWFKYIIRSLKWLLDCYLARNLLLFLFVFHQLVGIFCPLFKKLIEFLINELSPDDSSSITAPIVLHPEQLINNFFFNLCAFYINHFSFQIKFFFLCSLNYCRPFFTPSYLPCV